MTASDLKGVTRAVDIISPSKFLEKRSECHKCSASNWHRYQRCVTCGIEANSRSWVINVYSGTHVLANFIEGKESCTWDSGDEVESIPGSSKDNKDLLNSILIAFRIKRLFSVTIGTSTETHSKQRNITFCSVIWHRKWENPTIAPRIFTYTVVIVATKIIFSPTLTMNCLWRTTRREHQEGVLSKASDCFSLYYQASKSVFGRKELNSMFNYLGVHKKGDYPVPEPIQIRELHIWIP